MSANIEAISPSPIKLYTSCYVTSHDVNNWLRTPFIEVQEAESLYITMNFTMRKCVKHSDPSVLQQCRETFNLYAYQADRDIANNEMPSWDGTSYNIVDKITAKSLGESASDIFINTETRFISLQTPSLRGIYFAFQDEGACVSLVTLQVFYKVCPKTTRNYASFPATPTGKDHTSSVEREGKCVENASMIQKPTFRCMSDGSWDIPLGKCQCDSGFEGLDGRICVRKYNFIFQTYLINVDLLMITCPSVLQV